MSSFVRRRKYSLHGEDWDVCIKCDGCGRVELVEEGQTDRLLINNYVHEHNWKTKKEHGRWVNYCPDCISALREKKRAEWLGKY